VGGTDTTTIEIKETRQGGILRVKEAFAGNRP
jgi:hypothetical protein